jgi:hypothetical protein
LKLQVLFGAFLGAIENRQTFPQTLVGFGILSGGYPDDTPKFVQDKVCLYGKEG